MRESITHREDAIIDNTNAEYRIVVLIDQKVKYIQKFFIDDGDSELIERCKLMRKLKIPSL